MVRAFIAFVVDSAWWFRHYQPNTPSLCFGSRTSVPHDSHVVRIFRPSSSTTPSMVIRKIHTGRDKIPDTLPHAHLYLEDVQEITNILLEATAAVLTKFHEKAKIVYRVGDLQTDSIDDLRTLGGSATDFQVSVGSRSLFNSVQLRGHLEPQIRLYSMGQQECRDVHAKLEPIFDQRQLTIKNAIFRGPRWNAIFRLPGWVKWIAFVVILMLPGLFSAVMRHIHSLSRVVRLGPTSFVGYWIFVALLGFIYFWPSRVSFVQSYESASRRKAFVAIMLLVTVAVVAGAIRLLFRHLVK